MLQVTRMRNAGEPGFAGVWELYRESFPRQERRPFRFHAEAMEREEDFVCLRLHGGTDPAVADGLLFYWHLPQGALYVEHLAIAASKRGQGWGYAALQYLESMGKPIILEIEPVVDDATRRRLRFYESAGYVRLPYPHAQLPFRRGGSPVPMELLCLRQAMPAAEVSSFQHYLQSHIMRYRER